MLHLLESPSQKVLTFFFAFIWHAEQKPVVGFCLHSCGKSYTQLEPTTCTRRHSQKKKKKFQTSESLNPFCLLRFTVLRSLPPRSRWYLSPGNNTGTHLHTYLDPNPIIPVPSHPLKLLDLPHISVEFLRTGSLRIRSCWTRPSASSNSGKQSRGSSGQQPSTSLTLPSDFLV